MSSHNLCHHHLSFPASNNTMPRSGVSPRSRLRQSSELFDAFNGPSEANSDLPGYNELSSTAGPSTANHVAGTRQPRLSNDVFFDAGEALPPQDPLGVNRPPQSARSEPNTATYDFERPEYFPAATRRPPELTPPRTTSQDTLSSPRHQTLEMGFDTDTSGERNNGYSRVPSSGNVGADVSAPELSRSDRLRLAVGRFGRFVGMGIPGARYATLSQDEGAHAARMRAQGVHRPRVMGGGIGQDGVFANLSAKPERRRRGQGQGTDQDRGEDDDLEDNVQPPTYEIAAADAVPQYWETTILGGGGMHPLVNGLGWTPGGAHVGAIEDLIVEGLPVGNFFGFAWNLLVSMTFQFVGFLLTYLLHTTHAARCGSRAGLGITLIQYGFYLRTRASEIAAGKVDTDPFGGNGHGAAGGADNAGSWFGDNGDPTQDGSSRRQTEQQISSGGTMADAFAAQADGSAGLNDSMSQSTEWLAYVLMVLGWFILLSSTLSYWRIFRWGRSLVVAARRDEANSTSAATTGSAAPADTEDEATPATAATGFVERFRSILSRSGPTRSGGTGEDWVVFPGMGHRLDGMRAGGRRSRRSTTSARSASYDHPTSIGDLEDEDGLDTSDAQLNPAERRLLQDVRSVL